MQNNSPKLEDFLPMAKDLIQQGYALHWLNKSSKIPVNRGWSEAKKLTYLELKRTYKEGNNIGIRLGKYSETNHGQFLHVLDVDIRNPAKETECLIELERLFPDVDFDKLPTVISGSGGGSRHFYFQTSTPLKSRKLYRSKGFVIVNENKKHSEYEIELFGTGKQVVLPPSIHPVSGLRYRWNNSFDFYHVPVIPIKLFGQTHMDDNEQTVSTGKHKVSLDQARVDIMRIEDEQPWEDYELWLKIGMALHHQFDGAKDAFNIWCDFAKRSKKFKLYEHQKKWKSFYTGCKRPVTYGTILKLVPHDPNMFDGFDDNLEEEEYISKSKSGNNMPDLTILKDTHVETKKFPFKVFGNLAKKIKNEAKNAAAPDDFIAAGLLGGASACIGNAVKVQIKPNYSQPLAIWVQVIGGPSTNKSPALRTITSAIAEIERSYLPEFEENFRKWTIENSVVESTQKRNESQIKNAVSSGFEIGEDILSAAEFSPEPIEKFIMINDLTIEAFVRQQQVNPRGFMVYCDELASWLDNMNKYSKGGERGTWLQAYDGGSYRVNRVKDGNKQIIVPRLCSSIMGGIQPERLLAITAANQIDDGLQARILPFWPEQNIRPMSDVELNQDNWIKDILTILHEVSPASEQGKQFEPKIIHFATDTFQKFRKWSDKRKIDEQHANSRLAGVYGKSEGQVARLAALLEYIWWADRWSKNRSEPEPSFVSVKALDCAINMRENYFKPMQQKVFAHSIEPLDFINAREIAKWIVENRAELVNLRHLRRSAGIKGISSRSPAEHIKDAIQILIARNWVTQIKSKSKGRPSSDFKVNPEIWKMLEDSRPR